MTATSSLSLLMSPDRDRRAPQWFSPSWIGMFSSKLCQMNVHSTKLAPAHQQILHLLLRQGRCVFHLFHSTERYSIVAHTSHLRLCGCFAVCVSRFCAKPLCCIASLAHGLKTGSSAAPLPLGDIPTAPSHFPCRHSLQSKYMHADKHTHRLEREKERERREKGM